MKPGNIVGWDIGGAHIKAAIVDSTGRVTGVFQHACPLWKGMSELEYAVCNILEKLAMPPVLHAITMTGELVDLFENREQGVYSIMSAMRQQLGDQDILIFSGATGFLEPSVVRPCNIDSIASANWLASCSLMASRVKNALFVDIGSTTTDILAIAENQVQARGLTDYQRLCSGELLYTGIVRTPVMAVVDNVEFSGQRINLMAEFFATMADVYRLTGELNENHDQTATADGGEKSVSGSARRLTRMIGCDFNPAELSRWKEFAFNLRVAQCRKIQDACIRILSSSPFTGQSCVIGAGIGRFLVKEIADQQGYSYLDFTEFFELDAAGSQMDIADCAPAVSVAYLAAELL